MNISGIILLTGFFAIGAAACKKKTVLPPETGNSLEGGKGGDFNIAIFTKYNGTGKSGRVFLKYAADKAPQDTTHYDERMNTMVEPGFGPHVHFEGLKKGSYYIYARSSNDEFRGDTVLVLTDSTQKVFDFDLKLE